MRLLKIKHLSIICVFIILLMPCCNAVARDVTKLNFEKEDFPIRTNEVVNNLDKINLSELFLFLKFARITIVYFTAYRITNKLFEGKPILESIVNRSISLIYLLRMISLFK